MHITICAYTHTEIKKAGEKVKVNYCTVLKYILGTSS